MYAIQRILVPVDYSEISRAAISFAIQLADQQGAELWLLRVQADLDRELQRRIQSDPHGNAVSEGIEAEEQQLRDALDLEYTRAEQAGTPLSRAPIHLHVSGGDWMEVAVQMVEDEEIDVIVTGTHGPKGVKGMLLGSMSQQLVGKSTCSVFVVKPKGFPYLRD